MATTYKVLGQSAPSDTNKADLYTVGSGKSAVISTLTITNTTGEDADYSVFVRVAGAAASAANAISYGIVQEANTMTALTLGITLAATDVLTVKSGTASALTFQAFGSEIS